MGDEHLQHLMKLIEAKQIYTSYALLKKMPADTYIPGKQKILDELKTALIKGKAIHAILQNSRNNGDYPTALNQSLKLQKIVPDYPNLKHDIVAIEKTLAKLQPILSKAKIAASHGRKKEVITLLQTVRQIDNTHEEIAIIEKTVRRRALKKSSTTIIVSVLIFVLPCLLFGVEKIMVWKATDNLNDATQQTKNNQFNKANQSIAKMHGFLNFVHVFSQIDKESLITRATSIQNSITFVQGMRGRVLHDGEFVNKRKKKIFHQLEILVLDAVKFTRNGEWQKARGKYNEALEYIKKHEAIVGSEQQIILDKIVKLKALEHKQSQQLATDECLAIIALAHEAFTNEDWQRATTKYTEAFDFAQKENVQESCFDTQSTTQYNTLVIKTFLEKGDALRKQNKPSEAVDLYLQASDYATEKGMDETTILNIQSRVDSLKEQVFMARVRLLIREGDHFIAQGDFEAGLSKYNFGLTMLESNTELIAGKAKLNAVLTKKVRQTEKNAAVTTQTAHLENVAEANLRKYFAIPQKEKLGKLSIKLIEQKESVFIYRISAKSIREKVMYELIYQFDDNTGKWTVVQ